MNSTPYTIDNLKPIFKGRLPGQLVIQYSNRCNADCPQCSMRRSNEIPRFTLKKDHVRRLIDNAAEKGIKSLSFTGGEPLLFLDDIVDLTRHATAAGIPYIRTGTNGYMFRNSDRPDFRQRIENIAGKLASTELYTFWISLDSAVPADHEEMRGLSGVVKGIEKALPIFHSYNIYPAVNLGINRATGGLATQVFLESTSEENFFNSFRKSFENFYSFVSNLGFTMVNACYPMSSGDGESACIPDVSGSTSSGSVYGASSADRMITFSPIEKGLIFKALFEVIPRFRGKLRIFSPRCSIYGLMKKFGKQQGSMFPCRGGTDFFFVECRDGMIHPCGYREEPSRELPDLICRNTSVADCDLCDWECFRDPSDLLGPFAEMFSRPVRLFSKFMRDPQFFRLLVEDLRYYKACGYFNGRLAPELQSMKHFERTG